jgi:hypothetical protein
MIHDYPQDRPESFDSERIGVSETDAIPVQILTRIDRHMVATLVLGNSGKKENRSDAPTPPRSAVGVGFSEAPKNL